MRISDWSSDVCSSDLGCRTSRGEQGTDGAKGSQDIRIGAIIDIPAIVAGQRDMLPAQWCDVARDFVGRADVHQRHFEIAGVPQDDSGDEQVRSEEHTSELQSLMRISYAVFCLKKKQKHEPSTQEV